MITPSTSKIDPRVLYHPSTWGGTTISGCLGAILGLSWAYVGATLGHLGAILELFWAFLGLLYLDFPARRSQSGFQNLCFVDAKCLFFGILPPWLFPEPLLEHPGGHLGPSWPILKPPWSYLVPYWADLGTILGLPGAILAEVMQNLRRQILCNANFARPYFA